MPSNTPTSSSFISPCTSLHLIPLSLAPTTIRSTRLSKCPTNETLQPPSADLADGLSPDILHEQRFTGLRTAWIRTVQRGPCWKGNSSDSGIGGFTFLLDCYPETETQSGETVRRLTTCEATDMFFCCYCGPSVPR